MSKIICFVLCAAFAIVNAKFSEPLTNGGDVSNAVPDAPEPMIDSGDVTPTLPESPNEENVMPPAKEPTGEEAPVPVPPQIPEDSEKKLLDNVQDDANTNEIDEKPAVRPAVRAVPTRNEASSLLDTREGKFCPKFFEHIGPCINGLCPVETFCILSTDACCRRTGLF